MDEKETPSNVVPIRRGPGDVASRFRIKKNAFFDKLLGPEQVEYKTGASSYDDEEDNSEGFGVKEAGPNTKADVLNGLAGKGRIAHLMVGAEEAKIISMGKFKEERDIKRMQKNE